jgi:hypothetical protein
MLVGWRAKVKLGLAGRVAGPQGSTRQIDSQGVLSAFRFVEPQSDNSRIVASLDRKRLGADFWGGAGYRTEAFSIRRLGGSRWRLRRTRCAMGFERQRGSEQRLGRAARRSVNAVRIVGMVLKMSASVCGKWPERRRRGGGHTSAAACESTSMGRQRWTGYEESK